MFLHEVKTFGKSKRSCKEVDWSAKSSSNPAPYAPLEEKPNALPSGPAKPGSVSQDEDVTAKTQTKARANVKVKAKAAAAWLMADLAFALAFGLAFAFAFGPIGFFSDSSSLVGVTVAAESDGGLFFLSCKNMQSFPASHKPFA